MASRFWACYPYTNDDILAVGILLEDVTLEKTRLSKYFLVPTRGPSTIIITTPTAILSAPWICKHQESAGTITLRHFRPVHRSALNTSANDQRMVFLELLSADAFPIAGSRGEFLTFVEFESRMLCGVSQQPRLEASPVRLPLPHPPKAVRSFYEYQLQMEASRKSFGVYAGSFKES